MPQPSIITATPVTGNGLYLPTTAAAVGNNGVPGSPVADELYLALRTELSMYGMSSICTESSGTAKVQLLNNHVIGCHILDGGACTSGTPNSQSDFIDSNTTVYVGPSVTVIPPMVCAPSFVPPQISGAYKSVLLSADGGPVDCNAVKAALP
jgi:hypothetical protein